MYTQHIIKDQIGVNNTGPSSSGAAFQRYRYHRVVESGFAEFVDPGDLPRIIPLVNRFSVDISGRIL